jgi:acyl-CoA thioesterase
MSHGNGPSQSLAGLLAIERLGEGEFTVRLEDFFGDTLGGDVLARSVLAAAAGACPQKHLASLHAHFFRPVRPAVPLRLLERRRRPRAGARPA